MFLPLENSTYFYFGFSTLLHMFNNISHMFCLHSSKSANYEHEVKKKHPITRKTS